MLRALLVVGLVVSLAVAVQRGRILEDVGLLGSCRVVVSTIGSAHEWRACEPGKLGGRPDLSDRSCTRWVVIGSTEYWSCPVKAESPFGASRA